MQNILFCFCNLGNPYGEYGGSRNSYGESRILVATFVSPHDDVEIEPLYYFVDSLQRKLEGKEGSHRNRKEDFLHHFHSDSCL